MDDVKKVEKKLDVKLLLIGVVVHLIIFYSIFDVYFKSPLIHGMEPVRKLSDEKSPAKRLCLFVADGLRADTFFNLIEKDTSMYLSKKRFSDGRFAISTTQVPTESRPGHVAMIAGFYEDISAVAKGWKENPVEFDSVFNQSNYTWSFGSPDILTMFQKSSPHVFARTYDASIEDFAAENASVLDTWVMHHFKKFLYHSQVNRTETKMLNQDGVVFFLHLLGIDTHGHSKKPHSQEYISNIFVVDDIVRKSVDLLNDHFKEDNQTVFIFTADHGMTDWGSHGSGDDSERLTPFVAWGAGIKPSPYDRNNLDKIEQVDISPLMSYLIGVPIPLNSIGKIPLDFLNVSVREKSFAFKQNALQIIQQLKIKRDQIKNTAIYFQEFSELTISMVNNMLETVEQLIEKENYSQAIEKMDQLIELSLRALDYYHKYHKFYLGMMNFLKRICIVLSCVGWIAYLFINNLSQTFNLENYMISAKRSSVLNNIFLILMVLMILISFYQKFPITFYLYGGLPILLWWNILSKYNLVGFLSETWSSNKLKNTFNFVLMIIGIEFMVLSFFYRWIFSLLLILYSCLLARLKVHPNQTRFKLAFVICSLVLSFFPLLPVIKGYNHFYLVYASCLISNAIYIWLMNKFEILNFNKKLSVLLMALNVASTVNIIWIRTSIDFNYGLPRVNQIFSYLMIPCCFLLPIFCEPVLKKRLTFILFTLVNLYQHLSISYEGIFIVVLCLQMVSWLFIEAFFYSGTFNVDTAINKKRSSYFVTNYEDEQSEDAKWFDVFRVYLLIFYLLLAFFGTGNMASINSFDPVSVYCFITVFSPFQMGILLFLKIMVVPFLIVIALFYCIYEATDLSMRTSFTILMIFSDLMALHFFFLIRTAGSWLDIGISISHYIIVMVTIIIVSLLFSIAQYLFKYEIMRIGLMRSIKNHILKFD